MSAIVSQTLAYWRADLSSPRFRALALGAPAVVLAVLLSFRRFLDFIEARPGPTLADPLLRLFAPQDVAFVLFPVMYAALIGLLLPLARHPRHLVAGLWAYALMIAFRMAVMYLLPLDPPPTMIALRDPFVELFGEQRTLTRDLFFSGHTATLFLYTLVMPTPRLRAVAGAATAFIAIGVIAQHAHYAVDVVAAPFFAYAAWRAGALLVGRVAPAEALYGGSR